MSTGTSARAEVVVVGGGPAGATAAETLARAGHDVFLLDRPGRIKPCGGAIPPRLLADFAIPESMLAARIDTARVIGPSARTVDMTIGGFVGMVDREHFDPWLRARAETHGARRVEGTFVGVERDGEEMVLSYLPGDARRGSPPLRIRTRALIGADGANSAVARRCIDGAEDMPKVAAYHEIIRSPAIRGERFDGRRCDVHYNGAVSPDFYGWVFPHGDTTSVGVGTATRRFSLRGAVGDLRQATGLAGNETLRREGAPIPLRPLARWDDGHGVLLAGDAAGVVAPASGEGIYYAMTSGRLAGEATAAFLANGDARELARARRRFMRQHGQVFWMLGIMQRYWYANDNRRERFVKICRDPDVQQLTWDAYMNKELVRAKPLAHVRIFFKNIAHLTGVVPA